MVFHHRFQDEQYNWIKITKLPIAADYHQVSTDNYVKIDTTATEKIRFIPYNDANCKVTHHIT